MAKSMPTGGGRKAPNKDSKPRPQGGKPKTKQPAKSKQMNTSMTKPGSGTRGSGKGCR